MRRFPQEVELVKRLFNTGWERNWGAVPLDDAEIAELARQLKPVVVPELVVFAERGGEPIGFAAAIPDMNVALRANRSGRLFPGILKVLWASRRITRLRVVLLGVLPEWRGRGIDALLYRRIWENGRARGYAWAEAGWVLEDNHAMTNALRRMGFRAYKTYRVYERALEGRGHRRDGIRGPAPGAGARRAGRRGHGARALAREGRRPARASAAGSSRATSRTARRAGRCCRAPRSCTTWRASSRRPRSPSSAGEPRRRGAPGAGCGRVPACRASCSCRRSP